MNEGIVPAADTTWYPGRDEFIFGIARILMSQGDHNKSIE